MRRTTAATRSSHGRSRHCSSHCLSSNDRAARCRTHVCSLSPALDRVFSVCSRRFRISIFVFVVFVVFVVLDVFTIRDDPHQRGSSGSRCRQTCACHFQVHCAVPNWTSKAESHRKVAFQRHFRLHLLLQLVTAPRTRVLRFNFSNQVQAPRAKQSKASQVWSGQVAQVSVEANRSNGSRLLERRNNALIGTAHASTHEATLLWSRTPSLKSERASVLLHAQRATSNEQHGGSGDSSA